MADEKRGHFLKLPIHYIQEDVDAKPRIDCTMQELAGVLTDLSEAVDSGNYIPQTPTKDNPALSDDYIFDTADENLILKDLKNENFVGKVKDLSKGAAKRKIKGFPQEFLYIFLYPCRLYRRDEQESGVSTEDVLIYIKVNNRKIPYKQVFIISFHKNNTRKK